jgi:hypothetical protein
MRIAAPSPGQRRQESDWPRWIVHRLALVLIGLALSLGVAEAALRLVQPIPSEQLLPLQFHERRLRRLVNGQAYVTFDPTLGWVTTPGIKQRVDDSLYQHNDQGLRAEREYAREIPAGGRRIAAFGDSFTYCHEVNFKNCWTDILEKNWPRTEVLNFGVPGYGPDQAWLRYQREGPEYAPCAVTIGFMLEDINRVVNRYRPALFPITDLLATKPRYIVQDGHLVLLPNPATSPEQLKNLEWLEETTSESDRWYFPGLFTATPLDRFELGRVARTAAYNYQRGDPDIARMRQSFRPGDEAFEVTGRVLVEFAREVERDGATPVVIIFSEVSEIPSQVAGNPPVYAPLLDWLKRERVPTLDVTPDLVAEAARSNPAAVIDHHYTPLGNRIVAQSLARQLPPMIQGTCGADGQSS